MNDEPRDDEILGRALSRAVETQEPDETPYERSRIATRPARRGFPLWQSLAVAAVLLLALGFGSWLTRPVTNEPVAAPASSTATPAASPAVATATAAPQVAVPERVWAYFTRDSLPPIGALVTAHGVGDTPDGRIGNRIMALYSAPRSETPAGTTNPLSQVTPAVGGSSTFGVGVSISGDLATLEFEVPNGWAIRDPYVRQFVQQVVYTATEESGIRRVLMKERGKPSLKIDQLTFDRPLTRDDVSGYTIRAPTGTTSFAGDDSIGPVGANLVSREITDGTLVRLTFEGRNRDGDAIASLPTTTVTFGPNGGSVPHNNADGPAPAYVLSVGFKWNCACSSGGVGHVERIDRSPLRLMSTDANTSYVFGLDDARPWRAYMPDPQHLIVEVGGDPRLVSDRIAVRNPVFDEKVGASFTLSGSARVFEANVVWRVKDNTQKIVASGQTTASLGTSALWGTFQTTVALPSSANIGRFTLEVYEVSPKDGSEQGLVAISVNR
jgi:hypothetical protein